MGQLSVLLASRPIHRVVSCPLANGIGGSVLTVVFVTPR
jgi:hypothetical protein